MKEEEKKKRIKERGGAACCYRAPLPLLVLPVQMLPLLFLLHSDYNHLDQNGTKYEKEVDPGWEHGEMECNEAYCTRKEVRKTKKKYEERVARMERVDDDGDDEERDLRRVMRASSETHEAEQACMDERPGGASSSKPPPNPYEDTVRRGSLDPFLDRTQSMKQPPLNPYEGTVRRGSLDPFLDRTQSMKQPLISSSIMGDMKSRALNMGRAISKFFHYNWIPPNVATSPYYRTMVDNIAKVGPGVKPPSIYEISGKYNDMEHANYKRSLEDHFTKWKEAERITYILEPLVRMLILVDADTKPTMGYVYDDMDRAKLVIEQGSRGKYGTYYRKLWKIIDHRWNNQLHQDIHAAAEWWNNFRDDAPDLRDFARKIVPNSTIVRM
ncbi:hypothetical protein CKAN_01514800 [Cinnamomum micranthum f. kanehirae]|uniref:Uncharacterized protein n=1 Tax=Cinnamomum micranthum f. kanehirae TaxID=337451 RepID=A0A443P661_9MAGN|nr:hypothetical protein CKAN_01514800 [Cinnamomum micranthum f. kanehirae]